jgi:uncharacterized protein (DUF983 family)
VLNIIATIYAAAYHTLDSGLFYLYIGSCEKVANLSLWVHLAINVGSTILLSASNCKYVSTPAVHA